MSVKLPPQNPTISSAPTSTAHVHPHAHGGKKGVRGKGAAQPGELPHEESYSDKVDEHIAKKAEGKRATSLGAALSQPQAPAMGRRAGASFGRPVTARQHQPQTEEQELKTRAAQAKSQIASLLVRVSGFAEGAEGAVQGFHQKLELGARIAGRSPQLEQAKLAFEGLDAKIRLGQSVDLASPHAPAAAAAFARFDALLGARA